MQRIEDLRTSLEKLVLLKGIGSQDALMISKKLDAVIVDFYKESKQHLCDRCC